MTVNVAAVNDAPVANNDTLAATEDTAVTYTAAQLLGNDDDGDPELTQTLTIASVTSGDRRHGGAQRRRHGDASRRTRTSTGAADFSYTVTDGAATSNTGDGDGERGGGERCAGGECDTLAATEDTAVTYTAAQLLGNDDDGDPELTQTLTIASVTSGDGRHGGAQRRRHGDASRRMRTSTARRTSATR